MYVVVVTDRKMNSTRPCDSFMYVVVVVTD